MRGEISYVWGYHEWGFWGAFNAGQGLGFVETAAAQPFENNTVHTYNAFYRVQFGDANEWKIWGGASHEGQGYVGSILRGTNDTIVGSRRNVRLPYQANQKIFLLN